MKIKSCPRLGFVFVIHVRPFYDILVSYNYIFCERKTNIVFEPQDSGKNYVILPKQMVFLTVITAFTKPHPVRLFT